MSTPRFAPDTRRSRRLLRIIMAVAATAALVVFGLSAWFFVSARLALPRLDGSLSVAGLTGSVAVVRDPQGVPAISAASLEDLFFAQGYVTAQDRLWQMDVTRRYASGRLSEVFGSHALKSDIRQRTLLMPQIAQNAAAALPPRDRTYLQAYARGVNAYIDSHRHSLPVEFDVLHYSPQPWTVVDSILVGASMSEMLNLEQLETVLKREAITAKIGPELSADLYPNDSFRDHPPVPAPDQPDVNASSPASEAESSIKQRVIRDQDAGRRRATRLRSSRRRRSELDLPLVPSSFESGPLFPGSNNWVVSGAHTASGKPLLSNDMHLPHQIPNVWYEVHLTSGNFDVAGVSLPGFPFVIVGHNQRIAWGFTNIYPAVTDFYVEAVNDRGEYLTPDGWKPPEHRREHIGVRWGKDVDLDVSITRHGPIITGLIPNERRTLALKWVLFDPAATQAPFFDVDSSQNWDEFRTAFSKFGSPGQNVVYADVEGHIGYQATGFVPLRPWAQPSRTEDEKASADIPQSTILAPQPYSGSPVYGADNSHEWAGYIPFDKLPSTFDPPDGIIATANGRITSDSYPYLISNEWGPPYRTERIFHFLNGKHGLTPVDMLALQNDVYSDLDRFFAQRFVYAVDHMPTASSRVKLAAEIMRRWDGQVTTDSAAASIVAASRRELIRLLLEPKLGNTYNDYRWFMSSVWLENIMLIQPPRWLPPNYSDFDAVLATAVTRAVERDGAPRSLISWHWGDLGYVSIQHPLFGYVPILSRWAGPGRHSQSGNGYTVKQVGSWFGPSERMTVNFADLDASTLNIVTGQSGNLFSRHFLDQWSAWYNGSTFVLPFSPTAVQRMAAHHLTLQPRN